MCLVISDCEINQMTEALPILQFVRDQIKMYGRSILSTLFYNQGWLVS